MKTGWILFVSVLLVSGKVIGEPLKHGTDPALRSLKVLLQQPEGSIDFAHAKLAIDSLMDPNLNASAIALQLNKLAERVRSRFPAGASNRIKLDMLISSLYQAGSWNDQQPFRYDLDDPLGRNRNSKLLATYLSTRKDNCVSMPILVLILGQKLDLPVTLATAPQHYMVKYLDDNGQWLNFEATGGGFKFDSSYIRETGISELALQNGIYLRPLSQRESVAAMAGTLMEHYTFEHQYERKLALADLVLAVDPKDVVAMAHKGAAYYLLLRERFMRPYPDPALIPPDRVPEFRFLSGENLRWYNMAEALGWKPPTPAQEAQYLESIRREKSAQGVPL